MNSRIDRPAQDGMLNLGRKYLDLLLDARRQEAIHVITSEVERGLPVGDAYVDVLQPVMYEVGRLWQTDEIDIATEHYVTAATQLLMARLFSAGHGNAAHFEEHWSGAVSAANCMSLACAWSVTSSSSKAGTPIFWGPSPRPAASLK